MSGVTGKQVKLFFDDLGKVLVKEGVIVSEGLIFIEIRTSKGVEAIPTGKVVRMEVLNEN